MYLKIHNNSGQNQWSKITELYLSSEKLKFLINTFVYKLGAWRDFLNFYL